MKKMNKKGFTLMEMLIVVAIIAVLVAISIPVMNNSLEKARDAADAANLRAEYAELAINAIDGEASQTSTTGVTITGTKAGFTGITDIAGVNVASDTTLSSAVKGDVIKVTVDGTDGTVSFSK